MMSCIEFSFSASLPAFVVVAGKQIGSVGITAEQGAAAFPLPLLLAVQVLAPAQAVAVKAAGDDIAGVHEGRRPGRVRDAHPAGSFRGVRQSSPALPDQSPGACSSD